jgi:hypothetical protein
MSICEISGNLPHEDQNTHIIKAPSRQKHGGLPKRGALDPAGVVLTAFCSILSAQQKRQS